LPAKALVWSADARVALLRESQSDAKTRLALPFISGTPPESPVAVALRSLQNPSHDRLCRRTVSSTY